MKQLSFILFIPFLLSGQNDFVSLAISSDTINIGQMVDLDLTIKQSPNASGQLFIDFNKIKNLAYDQDTVALEEYADISISSLSNNEFSLNDNRLAIDVQSIKQYPLKLSMKASIFSIGAFAFSPSYIKPTGDTLISRLGDILFVMPPPGFGQDSTKVINDIKPIIEVESSWKDYLNYMYGFGGLLLLGFLAFLLYRRLKNKGLTIEEVPQPFEVVREAPHLIALRALDLLREEKPWNDGRIKYTSQASQISLEPTWKINLVLMHLK